MTKEREEAIAFFKDMNECTYGNVEHIQMAIKALEQQPSEDCVSRQAVLEKINDWWGITSTSGEPTLCDCIRDLPPVTPTQRWIPVSERLPEENGGYLVTVNQRYITTALWWGIPKYWDNVIAWMPLPKPYKAEMEDEE